MKEDGVAVSEKCVYCGDELPRGFGRCRNPACKRVRPEMECHEPLLANASGWCVWSGAPTDVRLPDGRYLSVAQFLSAVRAGWLDAKYHFTAAFQAAHSRRLKTVHPPLGLSW